jgi:quinolinate synthase
MNQAAMIEDIKRWQKQKNAVILAHNYQIPIIQDLADYTGDSLGLSQQAAATDADIIVFCGVHFMAETASILAPTKTVLIPDPGAGCSLAESITVAQLRTWKAEHEGAVVVAYVNTSAAIKAESDYCVTSANALRVVASIPDEKTVLFLPDMYLGGYIQKMTGRENMEIWAGECHVHAGIKTPQVNAVLADNSEADLLIHPECGCTSDFLYDLADDDKKMADRVHIFSTSGMVKHVKQSSKDQFLVATETGILHKLQKDAPRKKIAPVNAEAFCEFMKMITLDKLHASLRDDKYEVKVQPDLAERALLPIQRMLAIT